MTLHCPAFIKQVPLLSYSLLSLPFSPSPLHVCLSHFVPRLLLYVSLSSSMGDM